MFDPFNMFDPFGAGRRRTPTLASLFGPSDVGILFEPQVRNTMWRDAAGVTPVSTYGQGVMRWGDRSGGGRNATQASAASALIYGRHPVGGARNLLTWTEDFSNAAWTKESCVMTQQSGAVWKLAERVGSPVNGITGHCLMPVGDPIPASSSRVLVFEAKADARSRVSIHGRSATAWGWTTVDLITGATVAGSSGGNVSVTINSAISLGDGWWRITATVVMVWAVAGGRFTLSTNVAGAANEGINYVGDGVSGILIRFPQLGVTATDYQKVTNAYDVTEAGKADCYYALCDGADNSLATAAFAWGSDKATIIAAIGKTTSHVGVIAEFSPDYSTNAGSFYLVSNNSQYDASSRGNAGGSAAHGAQISGVPAADTAVITATHDVAGDLTTIRRNGVGGSTGVGDKGTGNFGTYGFNIGRRNGATIPLNAKIYGLFAINRILSADELALAERLMAAKYGGTL